MSLLNASEWVSVSPSFESRLWVSVDVALVEWHRMRGGSRLLGQPVVNAPGGDTDRALLAGNRIRAATTQSEHAGSWLASQLAHGEANP